MDTPLGLIRVAIVVPKFKYTAIRRNKLKRQLRELTRVLVLPRAGSCDLLLRARREAFEASFEMLRDDVHQLARSVE